MTWSAQRDKHRSDDKRLMGQFCAAHHFLVPDGSNPAIDAREPVASIIVNPGTTGNVVVREVLLWIADNPSKGPFNLIWYTPSALVPATLRTLRLKYPALSSATQLFLIPGRVDVDIESVSGDQATHFIQTQLDRSFTYAFLSANSLDITEGVTYFHFKEEVPLQRACAMRVAAHKFLFFDPTKFKSDGEDGYTIGELLTTSKSITIYTVSSSLDGWIKYKFQELCGDLLDDHRSGDRRPGQKVVPREVEEIDKKSLRLQIVSAQNGESISLIRRGFLRGDKDRQQTLPQSELPGTRHSARDDVDSLRPIDKEGLHERPERKVKS